jgi:FHA domain
MDQPTPPRATDGKAFARELSRAAHELTLHDFTAAHPHYVLAVELAQQRRAPQLLPFEDAPTGVTAMTELRRRQSLRGALFAVSKSTPICHGMITVGRNDVHDVWLDDPSVSRFHAFFRPRAGLLYVVDAGSRLGTRVDGRTLRPHLPELVIAGALLQLGDVPLRVLAPAACWDLLRAAQPAEQKAS